MALFEVGKDRLTEVMPTSFSAEAWRERGDLQRYLRDQPESLEPGLFILSEEYSNWADSGRRVDLLGLDETGRLVVIELKLDNSAAMDLQAIRYAAMVANMTFEQAVEAHQKYLTLRGRAGDARELILQHLGASADEDFEILSARPRILLVAADFHRELTTSVLWLNDAGLDIECVRAVPYRLGDRLLLHIEKVIPLPEAQTYVMRLRDKARENEAATYPIVPWTEADFELLADNLRNPTLLAIFDLCAARPGEFVPFSEIILAGGQSPAQARGATGGFTPFVRKWFGRNNWPLDNQWSVLDDGQQHYRLTPEHAAWWLSARRVRREASPPQTAEETVV